jgi:hypothetical protein
MNWKVTAVVSGASVLAAWMGLSSPGAPQQDTSATPRVTRRQAPAADIQQEAAHLQSRLRPQSDYRDPVRNPFVFGERADVARPRRNPVASRPVTPAAPVAAAPAPPPFTLAGIGSTQTDAGMQHTAILSTPAGVVIARQGDSVDGGYRVDAIDDSGVMLKAADGTVTRLSLKP